MEIKLTPDQILSYIDHAPHHPFDLIGKIQYRFGFHDMVVLQRPGSHKRLYCFVPTEYTLILRPCSDMVFICGLAKV